ncbi:MAG: phage major capsid protein [Ruminococcaceae bacterium]|nr:phage major capsid protein [Oscillospiraceae bacterium]
MHRKLLELKNKRDLLIKDAESAIEAGNGDAYDKAMKDVNDLNGEIERINKLLDEKDRFAGASSKAPQMTALEDDGEAEDHSRAKQLKDLIGSKSYKTQFFKALSEGISPKRFNAQYPDLYKAMTLSGGDPVGSDGGFLVPPDFETRVIELAKEMVDLSAYVHVESVTSPIGWRNVETSAARTRMNAVGEGSKIPLGDTPKFKRIDFSCKTYADRIAVSGELMENADGLMEYLAAWFAKKYVATKNALILEKLSALEFKAIEGADDAEKVKAIKAVFNKSLRTAVSKKAIVLTNQNGYDELDNLNDLNGRPYLKPDISGDFDRIKGRQVVYGDNDIIEDISEGDVTYAPMYIGDLASFVSLFVRNGMRMDVTNVGGEAWENGGYEIRVMCSMDCQQVDETAVVKRGMTYAA